VCDSIYAKNEIQGWSGWWKIPQKLLPRPQGKKQLMMPVGRELTVVFSSGIHHSSLSFTVSQRLTSVNYY
jgi:hypothetical protein